MLIYWHIHNIKITMDLLDKHNAQFSKSLVNDSAFIYPTDLCQAPQHVNSGEVKRVLEATQLNIMFFFLVRNLFLFIAINYLIVNVEFICGIFSLSFNEFQEKTRKTNSFY